MFFLSLVLFGGFISVYLFNIDRDRARLRLSVGAPADLIHFEATLLRFSIAGAIISLLLIIVARGSFFAVCSRAAVSNESPVTKDLISRYRKLLALWHPLSMISTFKKEHPMQNSGWQTRARGTRLAVRQRAQ